MWLEIHVIDDTKGVIKTHTLLNLSKKTLVKEFRQLVSKKTKVALSRFRLYFHGKQLVDTYKDDLGNIEDAILHDYKLNFSDIVKLVIKSETISVENVTQDSSTASTSVMKENINKLEPATSDFLEVDDLVDGQNIDGAWLECKVIGIFKDDSKSPSKGNSSFDDKKNFNEIQISSEGNIISQDSLKYEVQFDDGGSSHLSLQSIRPRARTKVLFDNVKIGDKIMVNHNLDKPKKLGFWYDFEVLDIKNTRTQKKLVGTIFLGINEAPVHNRNVIFIDDLYEIEKNIPIGARDDSLEKLVTLGPDEKRICAPYCDACDDKPAAKCRECSCSVCGGKDSSEKQVFCDECEKLYHLWCATPTLEAVPDEEWFCHACKNTNDILNPGEMLRTKKKAPQSTRDWGKGVACARRRIACTDVPVNTFGPIPNIEVGQAWEFRLMVSEAGVHRPLVAGIHGRESEGAYSIVLSNGYEDDIDNGDEFYYTGSGGRDLSGNKRVSIQSSDQLLTKRNKALALNCAAKINAINGAEAKNWKAGRPVRVIRGYKGAKHSKYCPDFGFRYDGTYKVVKYWPEKGKSDFLVWRYLLRRDDVAAAPWTDEGKNRIKNLGIQFEYLRDCMPDRKRSSTSKPEDEASMAKKNKVPPYKPSMIVSELISSDIINNKIWNDCGTSLVDGKVQYQKKVRDEFACIVCLDLVSSPITTHCGHNFCKNCLQRSFKSGEYKCPTCRSALEKDNLIVNKNLQKILDIFFKSTNV